MAGKKKQLLYRLVTPEMERVIKEHEADHIEQILNDEGFTDSSVTEQVDWLDEEYGPYDLTYHRVVEDDMVHVDVDVDRVHHLGTIRVASKKLETA